MADTIDNDLAQQLEEMEDQRDAITLMLARMEQANDEARPWWVVRRLHAGEHPVAVFRDLRSLSVEALATKAGVGTDVVTAIEAFEIEGGLRPLRAIARALEVDLDDLIPWEGLGSD